MATLLQTQATSNQPQQPTNGTIAPTQAGVGQNDDAARASSPLINQQNRTISGTLNTNQRRLISPQTNVLDRFASYTYRASVYVLTTEQINQFVNTPRRSVSGYNLLFQSGGAPASTTGFQGALNSNTQTFFENNGTASTTAGTPTNVITGRSPAFDVDFYIDSIQIKNSILGKATGASHSQFDLKFTVIEPYGITLLDRMYKAVQDIAPRDAGGAVNYQNAQYLMVIRFYGFDQQGNLQKVGAASATNGLTDPNAVVEKFVPFVISNINWSVQNRVTHYDFLCAPISNIIAAGTRRGTVPYDMSITGGSVKEVLSGAAGYTGTNAAAATPGAPTTTTGASDAPAAASALPRGQQRAREQLRQIGQALFGPPTARAGRAGQTGTPTRRQDSATGTTAAAPPKADAAQQTNLNLSGGLMQAMNQFVSKLTEGTSAVYEVADQYAVEFMPGAEAIRDATIVLPGSKKEKRAMPAGINPLLDARGLSPASQSAVSTAKTIAIVAGQPVVQVIDTIIRNSSYIYDQQLTIIDAESDQEQPNPKALGKPVNWFQISFKAEVIGYDRYRNDYAYKITYLISPYVIDNYDSKYFPIGTFRGVHKSYQYWFTGENTAVLDYNETLNSAYHMLVSGGNPNDSQMERLRRSQASTMAEMITYSYSPFSGQSAQQTEGRGNEASANLADSLYQPDAQVLSKLRILGDPAWIQQGSFSGGLSPEYFTTDSFYPDGTINFDAEQVLYEVNWQRPTDYNLQSGLARSAGNTDQYLRKSRVYQAVIVTSDFRQGRFESIVEGVLMHIPKQDGSNKAPGAPMPNNGSNVRDDATDALGGFGNLEPRSTLIAPTSGRNPPQLPRTQQSALQQLQNLGRAIFSKPRIRGIPISDPGVVVPSPAGTPPAQPGSAAPAAASPAAATRDP